MYWFARPPWIRWAMSACLLVAAFVLEIGGPATTEHWFAITDIEPGTPLDPGQFRAVRIPSDLFAPVEPHGFARTEIRSGDPLINGHITDQFVRVPDGWWVIDLAVPARIRVGQTVLLVVLNTDQPTTVDGVAVAVEATSDAFGGRSSVGSIAVPAAAAGAVASAAASGNISVLTTND